MTDDRRQVQVNYGVVPKTYSTAVVDDVTRECHIASASQIPYNYAPPPEGLVMATVPYKWPSDEDWSRY
jgi:hypothetical protein